MEQLDRSRWIKRSTQKKNKKTNCLGGVLNDNGHAYVIDCEETVWSFGHCSLMACLEAMIRIPSGSGGRGGQGARLLTAQHFPVLDSHGWHPSSAVRTRVVRSASGCCYLKQWALCLLKEGFHWWNNFKAYGLRVRSYDLLILIIWVVLPAAAEQVWLASKQFFFVVTN